MKSSFIGGIRIGQSYWDSMNYTWPFAKLDVEQDGIQITLLFCKKIFISKDDILAVEKYSAFISSGVKITHKNTAIAPCLIFWTSSLDQLINQLKTTLSLTPNHHQL
jgi:hypothetical protein